MGHWRQSLYFAFSADERVHAFHNQQHIQGDTAIHTSCFVPEPLPPHLLSRPLRCCCSLALAAAGARSTLWLPGSGPSSFSLPALSPPLLGESAAAAAAARPLAARPLPLPWAAAPAPFLPFLPAAWRWIMKRTHGHGVSSDGGPQCGAHKWS